MEGDRDFASFRLYGFLIFSSADLHQIIRSGQTLTNEHVQYFSYQILRGAMICRQSNTQLIKLKG